MPHRRPRACLAESFHRHRSEGRLDAAVDALPALAQRGVRLGVYTLASLLRQCLRSRCLSLARRVHLHLKITGLKHTLPKKIFLANQILTLHFACGLPDGARGLFDRMPSRNVFSHNAMLAGYAKLGMLRPARQLFEQMSESDRDVVSWNTMVAALARAGSCRESMELYIQMRRSLGNAFNEYSFSGVLVACVRLEQPDLTRQVHGQVMVSGYMTNLIISSSLVDAYAKCGCIHNARMIFTEMPVRDVLTWTTLIFGYARCGDLASAERLFDVMPKKNHFSWTALIGGYARKGLSQEALDLFSRMMKENASPDQFTICSVLFACISISSLRHGKQIHAYLIRTCFNPNAVVLSSLIDMYSKCGSLIEAQRVFDCTIYSKRDTVLWNTMIMALSQHGCSKRSVQLFEEMIHIGTKPDNNTFIAILTVCRHLGLFAKGIQIFGSMTKDHGIYPEEEHCACFVDLLGQAGHLEGAVGHVLKTPNRSSVLVWNAVLAACRSHGKVNLESDAAEHLIALTSRYSAQYVPLSDTHTDFGMWEWDSMEKLRRLIEGREVLKEQGVNLVKVESMVQ